MLLSKHGVRHFNLQSVGARAELAQTDLADGHRISRTPIVERLPLLRRSRRWPVDAVALAIQMPERLAALTSGHVGEPQLAIDFNVMKAACIFFAIFVGAVVGGDQIKGRISNVSWQIEMDHPLGLANHIGSASCVIVQIFFEIQGQ